MIRKFLVVAGAVLFASCAKEETTDKGNENLPIVLSATFSTAINTQSRATATAFEAGDELGLFVVKSGMEVQRGENLVNNHKMVVGDDGVIKGTPTAVYYPTQSVSLYSYYPYQSGDATADALGVLVGIRTDQTDFSSVKRSDLCYGSAHDIAPSKAAQPLSFKHSFSQIKINVTLYSGCPSIKQLRLINIKDSATLNIQSGALTLKSHTAEVLTYKSAENSYSAIIPAQALTGACIAIDLTDNNTTYIYNAVNPINLAQSATNTLNLSVNEKGVITLNGSPTISAWGNNSNSGNLSESINNQISLYWLAPHADYATADKITLSTTDPLGVIRDIDLTPTLDPASSLDYAVYKLNLTLSGTTYPLVTNRIRVHKGATLLRDCPAVAIVGKTLTKAGSHTLGIYPWVTISPSDDWLDVSGYGASRTITVTTAGTNNWTATASGTGLTVSPTTGKSGQTATINWNTNGGLVAPASRTGKVTFETNPQGATMVVNTSQLGVVDRININGLIWALGNLVANGPNNARVGAPGDGGLYFQYGGLIGYKGGANGDGTGIIDATKHSNGKWWNGAAAYSANDVAVAPATYATKASWPYFEIASGGFGYYYFNTFVTKYADFQAQANANNPTLGIGDPCAHYLGGDWRLPTYVELSAITGSATEGAWVPWSTAGVTGRWGKINGSQSAIGAWFGPNSRSGTPKVDTDLFIPASGHRYYNSGAFSVVGTYGYLWSSSVYNASYGFYMEIHESDGVYPRRWTYRAYGFPVRCVKDAPTDPQPPTADQIVTINGLKWTKGNLVANGRQNAKVGAPGDGGLYFQYGSLIGYKGGATGDGTGIVDATTHANGKWWGGAAAYSAADVAVAPATYATKATWPDFNNVASGGFGYYYFNTLATKYADFQSQANANNPTLGIGDPCAHYLGGDWRLPTAYELSAITGNTTENAWVPWTTAGVTGRWEKTNGPQSAIGAWFGPNSRTGIPKVDTDLFIPASGLRNRSDGAFYVVGTNGYLWSSSAFDGGCGFELPIHEYSGVAPRGVDYRAFGFPVRCVSN